MKIKYIREEQEITQSEVAKKLGVSRSSYGMWEQEHDFIPINRLNKFCNIFNVSIDYVLGFTTIKNYNVIRNELDKNIIKERLKNIRKENKITQEYLSENTKLTRSLISKYETGRNLIITASLINYCTFFNISADYLLGRIDEPITLNFKKKKFKRTPLKLEK